MDHDRLIGRRSRAPLSSASSALLIATIDELIVATAWRGPKGAAKALIKRATERDPRCPEAENRLSFGPISRDRRPTPAGPRGAFAKAWCGFQPTEAKDPSPSRLRRESPRFTAWN